LSVHISLRLPLALALVSPLGLLASTTPSAATTHVTISDCGIAKVAPSSLIISCADANRSITNITWHHWGSTVATGTGTLHWNTCTPTCVAGTWRQSPLSFRATNRVTHGATTMYTALSGPRGSFGTSGTTWTLATPVAG